MNIYLKGIGLIFERYSIILIYCLRVLNIGEENPKILHTLIQLYHQLMHSRGRFLHCRIAL